MIPSAHDLATALGVAVEHPDFPQVEALAALGAPAETVRDALAVGMTLPETVAWVRWMHLDALQLCLAAGLSLDELRATFASKRLPPRPVLDRLAATRSNHLVA